MTSEQQFTVTLDIFEGPFDLLLQLISRRKLDVTEVALSQVTDEFVSYVSQLGPDWDLDQVSSFLVVAATLLDLKSARLLPGEVVEDPEDLAVLEARDLLFARLLQYRAYKEMSTWIRRRMTEEADIFGRPGGLEEQFSNILPEVQIPGGLEGFVAAAVRAFTPHEEPPLPVEQLHVQQVSVAQQASEMVSQLRKRGTMTFQQLTRGQPKIVVVARFLALLELFRSSSVAFAQSQPLGPLEVTWAGGDDDIVISDEFEDEDNNE